MYARRHLGCMTNHPITLPTAPTWTAVVHEDPRNEKALRTPSFFKPNTQASARSILQPSCMCDHHEYGARCPLTSQRIVSECLASVTRKSAYATMHMQQNAPLPTRSCRARAAHDASLLYVRTALWPRVSILKRHTIHIST